MSFLGFTPNVELLRLSGVNVVKPCRVKDLMSNKRLRDFVAAECQLDLQVLRNMLAGQKLTNFHYKSALEGCTQDQKDQFAEDAIVHCLRDSQQSLQNLPLYSTQPSNSPHISYFDKLETLEMPFLPGFLDGITEMNPQGTASLLQKRIPRSLTKLTLRYVTPVSNVPETMEALAALKHQGMFPQLELVQLNLCRYSRNAWFPPMLYGDLGPNALKTFGKTLKKAGLKLEVAQTD